MNNTMAVSIIILLGFEIWDLVDPVFFHVGQLAAIFWQTSEGQFIFQNLAVMWQKNLITKKSKISIMAMKQQLLT